MHKIQVVGAGPGRSDLMTPAARAAIKAADIAFVAERHRPLINECAGMRPLEPLSGSLDAIEAARAEGLRVAVLVSGDTGIFSLLSMLKRRFGEEALAVHPGISALQILASELQETWEGAKIVSGHGRAPSISALGHFVRMHEKVYVFCDAERDAKWIASSLIAEGLCGVEMIVGERLSYSDQRISRGTPAEFANAGFDPLSVVLIRNSSAEKGLPPIGLSDEAFIRGKTPMTKREIRVQIISELRLPLNAVVWDIGAGTGSVSIECARQCPLGEVYAIERNEEALKLIGENAAAFRANNLRVVSGVAPDCFHGLPLPTHIFIGGSGGQMDRIFDFIESIETPVCTVLTAVTVENEQAALRRMGAWAGFTMALHSISRIESIGAYHMLKALNPIYIAQAMWEGRK